jgi:hypothetical protein
MKPLSDIDPTDHALATIASILEHPESTHDAERQVVDEKPLVPEPADADGYSKVGPGPMEALRFKWAVQRGDDGQYYVHETIGEYSTPLVSGPMTGEAAVKLVDERESEARHRFEVLRSEISGRGAVAELVRNRDGGEA